MLFSVSPIHIPFKRNTRDVHVVKPQFAGRCFREQRLAGSLRAIQQNAVLDDPCFSNCRALSRVLAS